LVAALVALPVACGGATGADAVYAPLPRLASIEAADSLEALRRAAAFEGQLPCDDCSDVRTVIVLHTDGSYRQRRQYRGRRSDAPPSSVTVGRWTIGRDSIRRLVLHSGEAPQQFEVGSELVLRPLDASGARPDTRRPLELVRVSAPSALEGPLVTRGEFRYFADAATFVACDGGRQFPIAGDSAFIRLQEAHRDHPLGAVGATTVDVVGRLELRAGAEEGQLVETVVVDSFRVVPEPVLCEAARVRAAIAVGDWQMSALDGTPLGDVAAGTAPTLRFVLSEPTMFGHAGCNRFTGRAVLRGLDLLESPLAMTKRMCGDSTVMAREHRYGAALSAGGWFRLDRAELVFAHGGHDVARFRRR
jgi:copper homeostasis protein (lipoprotein)